MNPPKVSVLLPTYNRAEFIGESLESVFAQTLTPSQVIVINDGSSDNTQLALEPFKQRIEYLESENRGKASALNLGMTRVTGDYVWIMDDDDVALPDSLRRHIDLLEQRHELAWTYSSYVESTSQPGTGRIKPGAEIPLPEFPEEEFFIRMLEEPFLIHPTILVRATCYRKLGPFKTNLIRSQDYEMALRLGLNYRCARISGPTIYHRLDSGKKGSSADRFDSDKAMAKWLEYDTAILKELREALALDAYLPRGFTSCGDITLDRRHAYLQRMVVMGRKTLFREMVADLQSAIACNPHKPLSVAERAVVRRLTSPINRDPLLNPGTAGAISSVCVGAAGLSIQLELAQAMSWRAATDRRNGDYRDALRTFEAAVRILGLRGLISIAVSKTAKSFPQGIARRLRREGSGS